MISMEEKILFSGSAEKKVCLRKIWQRRFLLPVRPYPAGKRGDGAGYGDFETAVEAV